ncbi:maleylacetoacetate isomerase [Colwellia chukchiensis]|uniref:maleylacetoacetate isomerase n=1 Tax=Colwellia chukchiensis TaxID=641665 RepID=UPI000A16E117|nr:maleylacetoacetate isomerase [Colwellia chukchiensis]
MTLYSYFRSSAAYRVRIALNFKQIAYNIVAINLVKNEQNSAEYRAINSQGLLPSLRLEGGAVVTQSAAILEWLEESYPEHALYPEGAIAKAHIRSLCNIIACDIHPLNNLRVLRHLSSDIGVSDDEKLAWYHHWIDKGFTSIENHLGSSPFAAGTEVTMADIYLIPQVYNALRFSQDMTKYPKIMRVFKACNELNAFKAAAPESQTDAL